MQTSHTSNGDVHCFIPLKGYVVAPLRDVTPEAVRDSARDPIMGGRDVKYKSLLNMVANRLGYAKGYDEFLSAAPELAAFKERLGLREPVRLIIDSVDASRMVPITSRSVADRLFQRGMPMPKRLFTGHGINWDVLWQFYCSKQPCRGSMPDSSDVRGMETWLGAHFDKVPISANLLSDQLLAMGDDPSSERPSPVVWSLGREEDAREIEEQKWECFEAAGVFRSWMCRSDKGWVTVHPFNDHVIFLASGNGDYDFVVRGQREAEFESKELLCRSFLMPYDIPCSGDRDHFLRWLYFEYSGWLDRDSYDAEVLYNKERWEGPIFFNGVDEALRKYLAVKAVFKLPEVTKPKQSALAVAGFHPVKLGGKDLWISDLITIRSFRQFMDESIGYADYRAKQKDVEPWEPTNCEGDEDLPAASTWYDAHAYAAWLGRRMGLGFRLLSADEYIPLATAAHKPLEGEAAERAVFLRAPTPFAWTTIMGQTVDFGQVVPGQWRGLRLRYAEGRITSARHPSELRFLVSPRFGEWLGGDIGVAVNTATLKSMWRPDTLPQKYDYTPTSNGIQDAIKIGFRLCCPGS